MGYIRATFIGKEYSIPEDVLIYIDLLDFTETVKTQLLNAFLRKVKDEIRKENTGLLGDEDLATEIEQQVGRFISKLCDNGIFTRTVSDYLNNNKGYQYFSDVNKAALAKMKSLLMQRLDSLQEGYEDAVQRADSHVTGMGFSIWSSSFVNHAIYAAMEASTINKQQKEASAQYQKEIRELCSGLESNYNREKNQYINNEYIPNMEAALTVLAYELLDRYVADMIAHQKFDAKALDFINIGRSNDLLKNLTLSGNKKAILENAFAACPYNIAVYMQAMKYDLLDYDSFQTAKAFKQDHHVLSFFRESWGEVSFPTKFNINYHCINVWASLMGKTSTDLLRGLTEQYATGIVKAYSRIADMMANKATCRKIIGELREDVILSGGSICIGKAREYVEPIVHAATWEQLTERCGHTDLLSRIKKCFPSVEELQSKKDFDRSVTEQLAASFEDVRKELAEQIEARRAEEERQRIERERQVAEQARIQAEKKARRTAAVKKGAKRTLIVVGSIAAACIALVIAGIIFLFATDKPIDNDFAERKEYNLHSLTYFAPENWEEDFEYNQSNENTKIHVRYDNWGNFVCMMGVVYHGETQQISIEDVVSDYTSEYKDATTKSRQIGEQEFTVISYVRTEDYNGCNVYVTESESSVFEVYFRSVPESTNPVIFDEIVGAIAFDDYVNPKEDTYNEAIGLMSAEKYDEAIVMFAELDGYKDSATKITECENAIIEAKYNNASRLMADGKYEEALAIFENLHDYKDCDALIQECNAAILENKYNAAVNLMRNGELEAAITAFESIIDYKDSSSKISECKNQINENKYNEAVTLANNGSYDDAILIFNSLGDYKDSANLSQKYTLLICEVGDVITLGTYEQDNNFDNGAEAIEWIVLERDGNKALVISKYCIEWLPFHNTFTEVGWKNSNIRSWLNNTFLNGAFNAQEEKSIISTQHTNPDFYDDSDGERNWLGTTTDTIFLLSSGEADKYFSSDSARKAEGTEYACNKGKSASWYWWLRSANNIEYAGFVSEGELGYGEEVDRNMGIRPAMWFEINSSN